MPNYATGDLVTFPLRGGKYGVAQLVHIDDLALHDLYHFVICDAVVDGAPIAGSGDFGEALGREHDVAAVEAATSLIEHIGLTIHGLKASDFVVVSSREVEDDDLLGYRAWLHLRYTDAVKRGVLRERIDDNPEFELDDEELEEGESEEQADAEEPIATDDIDAAGGDADIVDGDATEAELIEPGVRIVTGPGEVADSGPSWVDSDEDEKERLGASTLGIYDIPLGDALVRMPGLFEYEAYRDSAIARYIIGLADDHVAIDAIVQRFIEGDFAAGEELRDFGDAGLQALSEKLDADIKPEVADDILQLLVSSGEPIAWESAGRFMAAHGRRTDDPLYGPAVRGYCYAVMLTAGEPESLREHLVMLDHVNDPEFADDVRSAREALVSES